MDERKIEIAAQILDIFAENEISLAGAKSSCFIICEYMKGSALLRKKDFREELRNHYRLK